MADPAYLLVSLGLALALLVAMTLPAPSRPAEEHADWGLGLIVVSCAAAFAMGVVALLGHAVASVVLGATAWLLVMPCVWLARAPEPLDDGWYEEEEDDDGGSPTPQHPWAPPAPDERRPAAAPAQVAWTPAPQPAPVVAMSARVQRLLAAQQAERLLAAQEVERLLAAAAQIPLPEIPSVPAPQTAPTPLHDPAWPQLTAPPRPRGDHRSIAHILATAAHARTRRRAAAAAAAEAALQRRGQTPAPPHA